MRTTLATLSLALTLGVAACSGGSQDDASTASQIRKIAFAVSVLNTYDPDPDVLSSSDPEIYVMNPDGSAMRRLTHNFTADEPLGWSPDRTKIAFIDFEGRDLYVIAADGGKAKRLARGVAVGPVVDWSPDGDVLLFEGAGVDVVNADGSGERELAPSAGSGSWSPDGRRIAFVKFSAGVYVMYADGSGKTQLTSNTRGQHFDSAVWSPDGSKIAFSSHRGNSAAIYAINVDGTGLRTLSRRHDSTTRLMLWSPDGSKIAFSASFDDVYVMNADGSGEIRLVRSVFEFDWSPDGTKIVFGGPDGEIHVIDVDGSHQRRLTRTGGNAGFPLWSRG